MVKTRTSFFGNMYVFSQKDVHAFSDTIPSKKTNSKILKLFSYSKRMLRAGSIRVIK